jgi:molybdopterin converting factor small subunit
MHTYKDTKMKFSKLVESYKESKLKALSELMVEEATEEEFNKEIKTAQDQSQGKIKKKISAAATQAVTVQKEESELDESRYIGRGVPYRGIGGARGREDDEGWERTAKEDEAWNKKHARQPSEKIYHKVPFKQKDEAKAEGMRFDGDAKKWYHSAEKSNNSKFQKEEVQRVNVPAYLRKQKGEAPLKLDDLKRKDTMSDLENLKRMKKEKLGEKIQDMVIQKQLDEVISRDAEASEWITDFVNSADPRLEGKSKKERMKMALGAYYKEHPEKSNK